MVAQQIDSYFLRVQTEDSPNQFDLFVIVVQRTFKYVVHEHRASFFATIDIFETVKLKFTIFKSQK